MLPGFVSGEVPVGSCLLVLSLFVQVSGMGVLKIPAGTLMASQVILFSVMLGAGPMGMGGQIVALRCNLL